MYSVFTSDHGSVWERGKVRHIHFIFPLPLHCLFLLFFLLLFRIAPFTCRNEPYKTVPHIQSQLHTVVSYWYHSSWLAAPVAEGMEAYVSTFKQCVTTDLIHSGLPRSQAGLQALTERTKHITSYHNIHAYVQNQICPLLHLLNTTSMPPLHTYTRNVHLLNTTRPLKCTCQFHQMLVDHQLRVWGTGRRRWGRGGLHVGKGQYTGDNDVGEEVCTQ